MTLRRLLLVVAGGTLGTALRLGLALAIPDAAGLPLSTLTANAVGALLIGVLAARLPTSSDLRVFLATGMLGGFTTYSAFAVHVVSTYSGAPVVGLLLAAVSLFGGALAAAVGLGSGERLGTRTATGEAQDGDAA